MKRKKMKPKSKTQKTMLTETQTGNKEVIEDKGGVDYYFFNLIVSNSIKLALQTIKGKKEKRFIVKF